MCRVLSSRSDLRKGSIKSRKFDVLSGRCAEVCPVDAVEPSLGFLLDPVARDVIISILFQITVESLCLEFFQYLY